MSYNPDSLIGESRDVVARIVSLEYGSFLWAVGVAGDKVVYVRADQVTVQDGALHFWRKVSGDKRPMHLNGIVAAGEWAGMFLANQRTGEAVAQESPPGAGR